MYWVSIVAKGLKLHSSKLHYTGLATRWRFWTSYNVFGDANGIVLGVTLNVFDLNIPLNGFSDLFHLNNSYSRGCLYVNVRFVLWWHFDYYSTFLRFSGLRTGYLKTTSSFIYTVSTFWFQLSLSSEFRRQTYISPHATELIHMPRRLIYTNK